MSQQTFLMYAAAVVAILVAVNVVMRVVRALLRIAVVVAVAILLLVWGGSAAKTLTGLRGEIERATAGAATVPPVATNARGTSAQDRAIASAVAGIMSQARADVSAVRVSQTCRRGRRVVVVRYREPGFPFGLGRPQSLTVEATGGCDAGAP